jgi:hypothetical protein
MKVACTRYRMMTSVVSQLAVFYRNCVTWLSQTDIQVTLLHLIVSCGDAVYGVRNVIAHFVSNGSTVNVCAIGLSKAFDRMNHYVLYFELIERKLPTQLLTVIESWLNTCSLLRVLDGTAGSHSASHWLLVRDK